MLKGIKLRNFKCFEKLDLPCAPLTLLCGLNGMGKSSVFQSLLALRQSVGETGSKIDQLVLNHDLIELGEGKDVLYEGAESDEIKFELQGETGKLYQLTVGYDLESGQLFIKAQSPFESWRETPPFGGSFWHVSAERIGPRKIYNQSEARAIRGELGPRGEYALNYLSAYRPDRQLSEDDPRCRGLNKRSLSEVFDHWLQEITPGAHLSVDSIPRASALLCTFGFDQPGLTPRV